jgi:inhibitor of KinA
VTSPAVSILPLGRCAWMLVLGDKVSRPLHHRVTELASRISAARLPGLVEIVPAYATVTVFFEGNAGEMRARLDAICHHEQSELISPEGCGHPERSEGTESRLHTIPVRYDGPDLQSVANQTGLPVAEVIRQHSEPEYLVYLLGFVPGFAYLGDLHPSLVLPRRSSPRTRVPAGSVAIAGAQTAVYPLTTPGGWHLLGSTPLKLFDPERDPAAMLRAGDRVRFEPVR